MKESTNAQILTAVTMRWRIQIQFTTWILVRISMCCLDDVGTINA